jgi:hypothetical protein
MFHAPRPCPWNVRGKGVVLAGLLEIDRKYITEFVRPLSEMKGEQIVYLGIAKDIERVQILKNGVYFAL